MIESQIGMGALDRCRLVAVTDEWLLHGFSPITSQGQSGCRHPLQQLQRPQSFGRPGRGDEIEHTQVETAGKTLSVAGHETEGAEQCIRNS